MFQVSFERGEGNAIIGGPPNPEQDAADNVISVFVGKVIDPENPFGSMVGNHIQNPLSKVLYFKMNNN